MMDGKIQTVQQTKNKQKKKLTIFLEYKDQQLLQRRFAFLFYFLFFGLMYLLMRWIYLL